MSLPQELAGTLLQPVSRMATVAMQTNVLQAKAMVGLESIDSQADIKL